MNPEIHLIKLSVNDDEALERAAIAHSESVWAASLRSGSEKGFNRICKKA